MMDSGGGIRPPKHLNLLPENLGINTNSRSRSAFSLPPYTHTRTRTLQCPLWGLDILSAERIGVFWVFYNRVEMYLCIMLVRLSVRVQASVKIVIQTWNSDMLTKWPAVTLLCFVCFVCLSLCLPSHFLTEIFLQDLQWKNRMYYRLCLVIVFWN